MPFNNEYPTHYLTASDCTLSEEGLIYLNINSISKPCNVVIPDKINNILITCLAYDSFADNANIISVITPNGLKNIGNSAFMFCENLESVIIADTVTEISNQSFYSCTQLRNIRMSQNITTIGREAFYNCKNLRSIILPKTLQTLGYNAFLGCKNLDIIFKGNSCQYKRIIKNMDLNYFEENNINIFPTQEIDNLVNKFNCQYKKFDFVSEVQYKYALNKIEYTLNKTTNLNDKLRLVTLCGKWKYL